MPNELTPLKARALAEACGRPTDAPGVRRFRRLLARHGLCPWGGPYVSTIAALRGAGILPPLSRQRSSEAARLAELLDTSERFEAIERRLTRLESASRRSSAV